MKKAWYINVKVPISFSVDIGPLMLATKVWMILSEFLGFVFDRRYFKPTILTYLGNEKLA